jgi:hypothetical protein
MHRLKWEWDSITTFNQFVASFVHPLRSKMSEVLKGFEIEEITAKNIDERRYPGSTHLLRKDGDAHVIQVIQLREVVYDPVRTNHIALSLVTGVLRLPLISTVVSSRIWAKA